MKKIFLLVIYLLLFGSAAFATHNRAGEITYQCIGPLTYKITITTYTKTSGISIGADRPVLDSVFWGDGTVSSIGRGPDGLNYVDLPGLDIRVNTYNYNSVHTYPGPGIFDIHFGDPNRNASVINIPGSINIPFFLHTVLVANPFNGACDNSPVLLQPPIDRGCVGVPFLHNPNAYDPDGDSISYVLAECLGSQGLPIPGYFLPPASNSLTLNPVTGDLIWDAPQTAGEYNIAINVISWRNGHPIDTIERDMQILIGTCSNHPPVIDTVADTCVIAGDTLAFDIHASDPDGDLVDLTSTGGVYLSTFSDPAIFTPPPVQAISVTGHFDWITKCHHIRNQPYHVEFKAKDNNSEVNLVDLKGVNIYVIGPAPTNPAASPLGNSIILTWDPSTCSNATGYAIYRRTGIYPGTIECPCQTGVPAFTGYSLIGNVSGLNNTTFTDNDHGNGLIAGNEYCYIIVALYPDGAESCASPQVCSKLKKDLPVITNASVDTTDLVIGSMYVAWSKPTEIDTIQFPPPYQYKLYHSTGFTGANLSLIATFNNLDDTIFYDENLNTIANPYSYVVELYYNNGGNPTLKGSSNKASSVFLKITPTDKRLNLNWSEQVPWTNVHYDIFRFNSTTLVWDSIATSTTHSYADTGLINGVQYCYYIRSYGNYSSPGFVSPIINLSQQVCGTPLDNVSPCAPHLTVTPDCVDEQNGLSWNNPDPVCADDVDHYNIYFSSAGISDHELIATINDANIITFIHGNLTSLAGCYQVTAVDSAGNESTDAVEVCVDTCREYVLPSVFSPNGDGFNDLFHPCDLKTDPDLQKKNCPPYKNVKDVVMKIFNRWGNLVFETTNKDILWDGKNKDNGKDCPDGVYYYLCKVNFYRLNGTEMKELHGYVQLMRDH